MKRTERTAWTCGVCDAQLQPLDPSTGYHRMATAQLAEWGLRATEPLLALAAHVSVVHDDIEDPPGFPPMGRG